MVRGDGGFTEEMLFIIFFEQGDAIPPQFEPLDETFPVSKQIWPRFGMHLAQAYSMWAKHGPGLAEVVPGLRRHTRHGPDVKCSIWPRCQK